MPLKYIPRDLLHSFQTSSDLLCSMNSETNSNYSTGEIEMVDADVGNLEVDDSKVRDTSGNVYSKSPKQLSFSYRRPPPTVPTLQLDVLRSPKSERKLLLTCADQWQTSPIGFEGCVRMIMQLDEIIWRTSGFTNRTVSPHRRRCE